MATPDARTTLPAGNKPTALTCIPTASRTPASALSTGEEIVEIASVKPHVDAPVSTVTAPITSNSFISASATAVASIAMKVEPISADDGERREDGYVTPPLRVGYVSDYIKHKTPVSNQAPEQLSVTEEQHSAGMYPAGSSLSKLVPRDGSQHSAGIFTPILFAAQPLGGGILSPTSNKRKRIELSFPGGVYQVEVAADGGKSDEKATTPRRKVSSDYLRKGQWTVTEEKFARALIDGFEEGYLPIYTGIRLRGYLAVQLQCDPMRISKKLCGGSVDGKKIAKNYGQKKFKLRKKQNWNYEDAARILVTLEHLMHELWSESGVPRPAFLTLSSTRNAGDEALPSNTSSMGFPVNLPCDEDAAVPPSPEQGGDSPTTLTLSPGEAIVKKEAVADAAALPIIYLNLSKKHKKHIASTASSGQKKLPQLFERVSSSSRRIPDISLRCESSSSAAQDTKVDGDSLQAAYELLKLFQA